jgi:GNAT superfamily N-acetyltransferase
MSLVIETPCKEDAVTEFVLFSDKANEGRSAHWPAPEQLQLPVLLGESAFCEGRELRPFLAREHGEIVARALAVVDRRYNEHWGENIGHIVWFEALPGSTEAVRVLIDEASTWLAERKVVAARCGFLFGVFEFPLAMDAYDVLPPSMLRQNPSYYHTLLKEAGFEVEQGFVDYKLKVTPELEQRWRSSVDAAEALGVELRPLREIPEVERTSIFADVWADTFKHHWGFVAFSDSEVQLMLDAFAETSLLDTTIVAYLDGESIGFLFVVSDDPSHALLAEGRKIQSEERLNILGIGVRERARGRGVNYAMAGKSYLELAQRGWTHLSYTLVLDDNWPSRRTGEGLGCSVCANYLAYRRNFRR